MVNLRRFLKCYNKSHRNRLHQIFHQFYTRIDVIQILIILLLPDDILAVGNLAAEEIGLLAG